MTWDDLSPEAVGAFHARQRLAETAETLAAMRSDRPELPEDQRGYLEAYRNTCTSIAARLRAVDGTANGREGTLGGVSGRGR